MIKMGLIYCMRGREERRERGRKKEKEKKTAPLELPLLILVPGRAFSKKGERMGRGGGFYDRFFEKLFKSIKKEEVCLAGLCFSGQILDTIPMGEFDHPVDLVVTEAEVYSYGGLF